MIQSILGLNQYSQSSVNVLESSVQNSTKFDLKFNQFDGWMKMKQKFEAKIGSISVNTPDPFKLNLI